MLMLRARAIKFHPLRKTYIIKRQPLKLPPPCCRCLELAGVTLPLVEKNHSHDPALHEATKGFWFIFLKQKILSHMHLFQVLEG